MQSILPTSSLLPLVFFIKSSTDHITGLTGVVPVVTLSKSGAAFAAPAGVVAEIGNGWYKLTPTTADTNTLGALVLHATATGGDPVDQPYQVSATGLDSMTVALTEAYAATNVNATAAQLLYQIWSVLANMKLAGNTLTSTKVDGATAAMTFAVDSASAPTQRLRAS